MSGMPLGDVKRRVGGGVKPLTEVFPDRVLAGRHDDDSRR